jgi:hypothetical protein
MFETLFPLINLKKGIIYFYYIKVLQTLHSSYYKLNVF